MLELLPLYLVILSGLILKKALPDPEAYAGIADKAARFLFFPCLLFLNLASSDLGHFRPLRLGGAVLTGLVLAVALVLLLFRASLAERDDSDRAAAALSPCAYLGLAAAGVLFGTQLGTAMCGLILLATLPASHALRLLLRAGEPAPGSRLGAILMALIKDPLFAASLAGVLFNLSRAPLPPVFHESLKLLSLGAVPVGLLYLGLCLDFPAISSNFRLILVLSFLKMALLPAATGLACALYDVPALPGAAAILFAALPASLDGRGSSGTTDFERSRFSLQIAASALSIPLALELL